MFTSHTAPFETNTANAPQARRLRNYVNVRLAPLAAAVAVLAAIAGGTSTEAKAVYLADGTWAHLTTRCISVINFSNTSTKTRWVEFGITAGSSGVLMDARISVNGGAYFKAFGDTQWAALLNGTYSYKFWVNTVNSGAASYTVRVMVQFKKFINGQWQYSPNGSFQYSHHESQFYGGTQTMYSSPCTVY